MSRAVSFHPAAEDELNEAADFYDLESPGLGAAFINDIQKAIEDISQFPEAAPLIRGRVRRRLLTKFPYAVIYSLRETEIRILAIAHQKRRPFYWRSR
jgi:plasmid stabilization system protein ParE